MSAAPSDDNSTSAESSESEPTPTADDKTAAADNVVSPEAGVETVPDEEPDQAAGTAPTTSNAADQVSIPEARSGEAVTLTEENFSVVVPQPPRRRKPGPGLAEALLWVFGLLVVQLAAGAGVVLLIVIYYGTSLGGQNLLRLAQDPIRIQQLVSEQMLSLFCGVQGAFLVAAVVAAYFRLGRNRRLNLPLTAIPLRHCLLLGLLILPLMLFCDQLHRLAGQLWNSLVTQGSQFEELGRYDTAREIARLAEDASLPLLLVLVALIPAVAEELVFRGVIGRGLVARRGVLFGVLATSTLFAIVHLNPAHAFTLMPLAICMHLVYLATRSFWAPMAIHFVNNTLAIVALKMMSENPEALEQLTPAPPDPALFLMSGCSMVLLACLLWQTRVQYHLPGGGIWDPGYPSAEIPPESVGAVRRCRQTANWFVVVAMLSFLAFVGTWLYYAAWP